jgi:hypothetical protein
MASFTVTKGFNPVSGFAACVGFGNGGSRSPGLQEMLVSMRHAAKSKLETHNEP